MTKDEKFNLAKVWYDSPDATEEEKSHLEAIFAELKEGKDEKTRKDLIKMVEIRANSCDVDRFVSWIERHGCPKHSDNIEPKFKAGDWVIHKETDTIHQIQQCVEFFHSHAYGYDLTDGGHISIFKTDEYRLWTIQDAKDGDALVNGSNIFIFHCIDITRLMGYCHVNTDDGRFYDDMGKNECFCLIDAVVIPASKEQCNLLFSKMKESGYEWDAEKKVLKKIEQAQLGPKFKEEDWIVGDNTHDVYKVLCAVDGEYALSRNIDSNVVYAKTKTIDKKCHLWTIQDAKDGDVLRYVDTFKRDWVFIYKSNGFDNNHIYEYDNHVINHYSLVISKNFYPKGKLNIDIEYVSPATKEQRDLLLQKIVDAGYIWDPEKKELKKIEQGSTWDEKIKGLNELETYILSLVPDRPLDAIKVDAKSIRYIINKEQNPTAWTDKDWSYYNKLESFFEVQDHYSPTESSSAYQKDVHETLLWLKSLCPKHVAWSEEDERIQDNCIEYIKASCLDHKELIECIEWVESLKDRIKGE